MAKQKGPTILRPSAEVLKMKTLLFGPPGKGKTRFLGTANDDERTAPILILDYEGGISSLGGTETDYVPIRDWDDYNEVYEYLLAGDHPYKSIGLDSISETHIFALLVRLEDLSKRRTVIDVLDQQDYGIALVQLRRLLRAFRNLPYHLIVTALEKQDVDPRLGTVFEPMLVGSLAKEAPGIFDVVAYLTTTDLPVKGEEDVFNEHRMLLLQGYAQYRTKVRTAPALDGEIPDELIDPTITDLLDILHY